MASTISNRDVINRLNQFGKSPCAKWVEEKNVAASPKPQHMSYASSVSACLAKYKQLSKSKHRASGKVKYDQFLDDAYVFPEASPHLRKPKDRESECRCSYRQASVNIAMELQEKIIETKNLSVQLDQLKKSKISRLTVSKLKNEIKNQKRLKKTLEARLKTKTATLRRIRLRNNRKETQNIKLKAHVEQLQEKIDRLTQTNERMTQTNEDLRQTVETQKASVGDIAAERDWLHEVLETDKPVVSFFNKDRNMYFLTLRECIYSLLELNVSASNVERVIQSVLKLLNKKADKLPSKSTVLNMNIERLILSQTQLNDELPKKRSMTLYTDETTKFGTKYSGYHASDDEGRMYVLGMRQLVSKSGKDTLSALQEILSDIDERSKEADLTAKKILMNITATMSDRASTEKKFNVLLQELRSDVLPELTENWNLLSEEDQVAASTVLNFFCGLHGLVHFAESCNSTLTEVEKGFFEDRPVHDKTFQKSNESGALRLVRTSCKALARGADEKSGKFKEFSVFLKPFLEETTVHSVPLQPFHGNRFNILFESAAALFFIKDQVLEFLTGHQTNNLLKAVLHDLKVPEYMAGVKALALISRLITGPLWSLLEDKTLHIFDMNTHYLELVTFLSDAAEDIGQFMTGKLRVFGNRTEIKSDCILESVLRPWEHDNLVIVYLRVALPALSELSKKMYADHLPGGRWENASASMKEKVTGTQKHNKFAESAFGYLDQLLRKKPNVSVLASEAYLMFTMNKTQKWLEDKNDEERERLVGDARLNVSKVRSDFKRRKTEIETKHREAIAASMQKAAQQEQNRLRKLEGYTEKIIFFGLWQTREDVDSGVNELTSITQKKEALKSQLNFRKHVLKQRPDEGVPEVYKMSKLGENRKRVDMSVEELSANVKKLVAHAYTIPVNKEDDELLSLTGKTVNHKFATGDGNEAWWTGKVISQDTARQLQSTFSSDSKQIRDLTLEVKNMKRISKTFPVCNASDSTIGAVRHRLLEIDKILPTLCYITEELGLLKQVCHHGDEMTPDPEKLFPESYGALLDLIAKYDNNCRQKERLENLINQVRMHLMRTPTCPDIPPTLYRTQSTDSATFENVPPPNRWLGAKLSPTPVGVGHSFVQSHQHHSPQDGAKLCTTQVGVGHSLLQSHQHQVGRQSEGNTGEFNRNTTTTSSMTYRRESVDSLSHFNISLFPEFSKETRDIAQSEYHKRRPLQAYSQNVAKVTPAQTNHVGPPSKVLRSPVKSSLESQNMVSRYALHSEIPCTGSQQAMYTSCAGPVRMVRSPKKCQAGACGVSRNDVTGSNGRAGLSSSLSRVRSPVLNSFLKKGPTF